MAEKTKQKGTVLYPGVVLRSGHMLIDTGPFIMHVKKNRRAKTITNVDMKKYSGKSKTGVNLG